jgi:ATP/maltotriose-dependent transcriptional regulator MalT
MDVGDLELAELSGLVAVGETISFKHPLVRSAAYRAGTFEQRRRAHLALADVLAADPARRIWHRAAATVGHDEDVAAELEEWALLAAERSGHAAAARALERAADLSASAGERRRRLVQAATSASAAGQRERALALLEAADEPGMEGLVGVQAARVRGLLEAQHGSPSAATRIFLEAAAQAYPVDRRVALDLVTLAQEAAGIAGAIEEVVELGEWADRLGEGETTEERIMLGLIGGFARISRGDRAGAAPLLDRAVELGREVGEPRLLVWAASAAMFLGDDARVFALLHRAVAHARARGELGVLPFALVLLAGAERRMGSMAAAEADADEALRLARETGQEVAAAGALSTLTAVAAFRGDAERAEELATETRTLATPRGFVVPRVGVARALAELDLARGRAAEALMRLDAVIGPDSQLLHAPFTLFTSPLIVEAAVRSGERDRAFDRLEAFEQWTEAGGLEWARPLVARCRALLAATDEEADGWFRRALELHAAQPHPWESGRTQLLYGEFLRRARRKTDARGQLRAAADAFDGLGARLWAARATAELRATGATARKRDDSTRADLTPQELQIVRLVALGKTNPDVASELFLSPKTVQYHLRKVFVKLDIASRTQLTRLVAQGAIPGVASGSEPAPAMARP